MLHEEKPSRPVEAADKTASRSRRKRRPPDGTKLLGAWHEEDRKRQRANLEAATRAAERTARRAAAVATTALVLSLVAVVLSVLALVASM